MIFACAVPCQTTHIRLIFMAKGGIKTGERGTERRMASKWRIWFFAFALLLTSLTRDADSRSPLVPAPVYEVKGTVEFHFDGDTSMVRVGSRSLKIRYIGIDAPEFNHSPKRGCADQQPGAGAAKKALEEFLPRGTAVDIKVFGTDDYGRTLGEIFHDGQSVNLWMVRNGYAEVYHGWDKPPRGFLQAEKAAKAEGAGVWGTTPHESPKKFRRRCGGR